MFKNNSLSLRPLVAICAVVIWLLSSSAIYLVSHSLSSSILAGLAVALISYGVLILFLRAYLHRRIRMLYKFILPTKSKLPPTKTEDQELRKKSLEEVEEDVRVWYTSKNKELQILKDSNNYRKEFLQNLSHELKTPIFSIQGYIETLEEGAIDNKEVAIKFLSSASKGVERLVSLTESLDSISKLESGQTLLKEASFTPYTLIQDVYKEMSLEAEKSSVELIMPKKATEKIIAYADQAQIRQVLINLVHNAIKYCNPGNHIEAQISRVDSQTLLIEIIDDGPGIEAEHVSRIFERFYRTDSSRSRNIGGTGLGLAISKHIIEAHKQTIRCSSELGQGTSFGFTLARG